MPNGHHSDDADLTQRELDKVVRHRDRLLAMCEDQKILLRRLHFGDEARRLGRLIECVKEDM